MLCSSPELTALHRNTAVLREASDYSHIFDRNLPKHGFPAAGLVQLEQYLFVNRQFLRGRAEHRQLEAAQVDSDDLPLRRLVRGDVDQQRILAAREIDIDV